MVLVEIVLQHPVRERLSACGVQPAYLPSMVLPASRLQLLPNQFEMLRSLCPHLLQPMSIHVVQPILFLVGESILLFSMELLLLQFVLRHCGQLLRQ